MMESGRFFRACSLVLALALAFQPACVAGSALALEDPPSFLLKWGGPGGGPGEFAFPRGVAVGPDGTVYVADTGNQRVQRFTNQGVYLSEWTTVDACLDLTIDATGYVYVQGDQLVQKYDGLGNFITSWPGGGGGGGIEVDNAGQFVYRTILNLVFKYTTDGDSLTMWTAGIGGNFGEVNDDLGVGPSGEVYVMGATSDLMRVFDENGTLIRQWTVPGGGGVGVDQEEHAFVTHSGGVRKYASNGNLVTQWGSFGTGDGQFNSPRGVAFDADGSVYICDEGNHRIQKFGNLPTPVTPSTWGGVKARYRR